MAGINASFLFHDGTHFYLETDTGSTWVTGTAENVEVVCGIYHNTGLGSPGMETGHEWEVFIESHGGLGSYGYALENVHPLVKVQVTGFSVTGNLVDEYDMSSTGFTCADGYNVGVRGGGMMQTRALNLGTGIEFRLLEANNIAMQETVPALKYEETIPSYATGAPIQRQWYKKVEGSFRSNSIGGTHIDSSNGLWNDQFAPLLNSGFFYGFGNTFSNGTVPYFNTFYVPKGPNTSPLPPGIPSYLHTQGFNPNDSNPDNDYDGYYDGIDQYDPGHEVTLTFFRPSIHVWPIPDWAGNPADEVSRFKPTIPGGRCYSWQIIAATDPDLIEAPPEPDFTDFEDTILTEGLTDFGELPLRLRATYNSWTDVNTRIKDGKTIWTDNGKDWSLVSKIVMGPRRFASYDTDPNKDIFATITDHPRTEAMYSPGAWGCYWWNDAISNNHYNQVFNMLKCWYWLKKTGAPENKTKWAWRLFTWMAQYTISRGTCYTEPGVNVRHGAPWFEKAGITGLLSSSFGKATTQCYPGLYSIPVSSEKIYFENYWAAAVGLGTPRSQDALKALRGYIYRLTDPWNGNYGGRGNMRTAIAAIAAYRTNPGDTQALNTAIVQCQNLANFQAPDGPVYNINKCPTTSSDIFIMSKAALAWGMIDLYCGVTTFRPNLQLLMDYYKNYVVRQTNGKYWPVYWINDRSNFTAQELADGHNIGETTNGRDEHWTFRYPGLFTYSVVTAAISLGAAVLGDQDLIDIAGQMSYDYYNQVDYQPTRVYSLTDIPYPYPCLTNFTANDVVADVNELAFNYPDENTLETSAPNWQAVEFNGIKDIAIAAEWAEKTVYWNLLATGTPTIDTGTVPSASSSLVATAIDYQTIDIVWSDVANETSYTLEKSNSLIDGQWTGIYSGAADVVTYTDSDTGVGLTQDNQYIYRVKATNSYGDGAYTTGNIVRVPLNPTGVATDLFEPTGVGAQALSSTSIRIDWLDVNQIEGQTEPVVAFQIYRNSTEAGNYSLIRTLVSGSAGNDFGNGAWTFNDEGLTGDSTYWYQIRAYNNDTISAFTVPTSVTTDDFALVPPTGLRATTLGTFDIDLYWSGVTPNSDGYIVEASSGSPNAFEFLTYQAGTDTTGYIHNGLSRDTAWYYRTYAVRGSDRSAFTNVVMAQTDSLVPDAPTNLQVEGIGPESFRLTWQDNSNNEIGFVAQITTPEDQNNFVDVSEFLGVDIFPANTQTGIVSGPFLLPDTDYVFRLRAEAITEVSSYSNTATGRTEGLLPIAVTEFFATGQSPNSVVLNWNDTNTTETGYHIRRFNSGVTVQEALFEVPANTFQYEDIGLTPDTLYHYVINANNELGDGGFDVLTIKTLKFSVLGGDFSGNFFSLSSSSQDQFRYNYRATADNLYPVTYILSGANSIAVDNCIGYNYTGQDPSPMTKTIGWRSPYTQVIANYLQDWNAIRNCPESTGQYFINSMAMFIENVNESWFRDRRELFLETADLGQVYRLSRIGVPDHIDINKTLNKQLLYNGDFAIPGLIRYNLPDGWTTKFAYNTARVERYEDNSLVGDACVKVTISDSSRAHLSQKNLIVAPAGTSFTASIWHMSPTLTGEYISTQFKLKLNVTYADGCIKVYEKAINNNTAGTWHKCYLTFTAEQDVGAIEFIIEGETDQASVEGWITFFDAAMLERNTMPTQFENSPVDVPECVKIADQFSRNAINVGVWGNPREVTYTHLEDVEPFTGNETSKYDLYSIRDRRLFGSKDLCPTRLEVTNLTGNTTISGITNNFFGLSSISGENPREAAWTIYQTGDTRNKLLKYTWPYQDEILNVYSIADPGVDQKAVRTDLANNEYDLYHNYTISAFDDQQINNGYELQIEAITIKDSKIWAICLETYGSTTNRILKILNPKIELKKTYIEQLAELPIARGSEVIGSVSSVGFVQDDSNRMYLALTGDSLSYSGQLVRTHYDYCYLDRPSRQIFTRELYTGQGQNVTIY